MPFWQSDGEATLGVCVSCCGAPGGKRGPAQVVLRFPSVVSDEDAASVSVSKDAGDRMAAARGEQARNAMGSVARLLSEQAQFPRALELSHAFSRCS